MRFFLLIMLLFFACQKTEQKPNEDIVKIADGLNFAEGPAWSEKGDLFVSNCYGDWITRISGAKVDTFVIIPSAPDSFKSTNGMTMGPDGYLYACDFGLGKILRFAPDGACETYANGYAGKKFNRPNDLAFDPEGNLYFTDPNKYDPEDRDGAVYRVRISDRQVERMAAGLAFPNGIAFDAPAENLFICESAMNRILKFPVNKDGSLGLPTVFVTLPGGDPDGIAFDEEKNLYAAHFGTGTVFVIDPMGKIIREIKIPGKKATNVEFGGEDMKTLFITDAETNAVYKTEVGIAGLQLF